MAVANLLGWAAAALTLLTFSCTNMQRLRLLALSANGAFVAYALMAGLTPVLALHFTLIPVNLYRLVQARERQRAEAAVALAVPGKSESLSVARPVQSFVMETRVARLQMGGCASSLRKSLRSRPRGPVRVGKSVASGPVHASSVTAVRPPSTRLDGLSRQPHVVVLRSAERAVAQVAGQGPRRSVALLESSRRRSGQI